MRPRTVAIAIMVIAAAAMCVRLGSWQVSRLHEKQALNARLRSMLAEPPVAISSARMLTDSLRLRRVRLRGGFDERRQVLLSGRFHAGTPGVHVLTPLVLEDGGGLVLVDRGWLESEDAVSARPQDYPVPGIREVIGIGDTIPRGEPETPIATLEADSVTVLTTADLDWGALARRLGPELARFLVTELPDAGHPGRPVREAPRPYEEFMHLSYAVQWFSFAVILLAGSGALAWSRRRPRDAAASGLPPESR